MKQFVFLILIFCFIMFPFIRAVLFNLHNIGIYSVYDIYTYFRYQKWKLFNHYGIDMFVGMFGHGKTLSMTHRARQLYKKYGNTILFVSNYKLIGIPYVPLINFNQLLELGEEQEEYYSDDEIERGVLPDWYYDDNGIVKEEYVFGFTDDDGNFLGTKVKRWKYQGTVVLIDEIEDVLSHRNYASFPLQLLNTLTQQRKKHIYIMCSAQRFFMVDKIFRSITTNVIDCNKYWRFQNMRYYDAWDYENAMNVQLIKCLSSFWWFVKNKDFDTYDTEQMISKTMSEDFISNDEKLARLGLDNVVNDKAVSKPSRRLKKDRKRK